jgi:phosphoribosylglycinamide formyltransferase
VIDKIAEGQLNTTLVRVLSNRKDAFGLERASKANIPTLYHNLVKYKKQHPATTEGVQAAREEYDAELARLILADGPELVICLGFMHILSPQFLEPLEKANVRIINLHPALPGQFNGVVSSFQTRAFPCTLRLRDVFSDFAFRMQLSGLMLHGWKERSIRLVS